MKRFCMLLLVLVLVLVLLCACSSSETSSTYTVVKNDTLFTVDTANGTISDGTNTYAYVLSGSGSGYSIEITYPDGSSYWWRTQTSGNVSSGYGGWSDDYDESRYVDGDTLCEVLEERAPKSSSGGHGFLAILFLAIGLFNTISPSTAWYLEYGWRYKNAEPSDLALELNRFGGIVAIIAGIILIFV